MESRPNLRIGISHLEPARDSSNESHVNSFFWEVFD